MTHCSWEHARPNVSGFRLVQAIAAILIAAVLCPAAAHAETGAAGWLRYAPVPAATRATYASLPGTIVLLGDSPVLRSARDELIRGVAGLLARQLTVSSTAATVDAIVLGEVERVREAAGGIAPVGRLQAGGFLLRAASAGNRRLIIVAGQDDRGVLYGTFALLRHLALGRPIAALDVRDEPAANLRWVNEWDNLDGTIERGYAGRSIFFENDNVRSDLARVGEYGRLLASLGINGIDVSNVNANARVITADFVPQLARLADALRPWGVRLAVSVDFSSPQRIGGLDTFDPLDARVATFWKTTVDRIYARIPDFGGFVLKADSEGRLGPSAYGRSHADAANVIARPLAPHGGVLF